MAGKSEEAEAEEGEGKKKRTHPGPELHLCLHGGLREQVWDPHKAVDASAGRNYTDSLLLAPLLDHLIGLGRRQER